MFEGHGSLYLGLASHYKIAIQHIDLFYSFITISTMAAVLIAAKFVYGQAFLLMTASWNGINLMIALWLRNHIDNYSLVTTEWLNAHLLLVFGINLGLDVLYIILGSLLKIGNGKDSSQYKIMKSGFAYAIIAQGIGMFLIDLVTFLRILLQ